MKKPRSDALVFFGATGDLAYKKIPAHTGPVSRHGAYSNRSRYEAIDAFVDKQRRR